ncbi:decarboxylating NADP(+)-dependent phosphogluconate dehydrogenase [Oceanobacillus sp. J11TS1]|uniref:decarboxylating NADP(+)-dependent phosphogluconate dehydrogenase n=1 Tax=Oceanobacillus sp. J11TS1 TaxID=2807191 RepID=UPI001B1EC5B6|nr:decarboxylating NADP(+)-dependent phosphogluconate dehydrogenase [Oceanobacillus sp. J11TS1]GIO23592.1 6-phosphogluconate dehydrogenase, NAD(+)-dependent, decarboxylating [Oceanobacillus sp. J11TS1]
MNSIGVFGLGVMGANLALNMENKGEKVAVYNYTPDLTDAFQAKYQRENIEAHYQLENFVNSLEKPRKIFLMVTAGAVVDTVIDSLLPLLDQGDIIMDGGNSNFEDSNRRYRNLKEEGFHFISVGVSGGEEGALNGPALMPSGDREAYQQVAPILEKIAAQVDGKACCSYLGKEGSGHYVKMVHNGIEYADMQLITEAYQFLRDRLDLDVKEIAAIFEEWNRGELESYLLEITSDILTHVDKETNQPMVDVILDKSGQKGTGKWTSQNALDIGVSLSIITESVFMRFLSTVKEERMVAEKELTGPNQLVEEVDKKEWIELVRQALFMGKICTYAQGFYQYKQASEQYNWDLHLDEIALIFRGGCIIRAGILNEISDAFKENKELPNLFFSPFFKTVLNNSQTALRKVVIKGMETGLALPCLNASLVYYDGYRSAKSGANIIQAQRDYFGAHTYQRIDREGNFHTEW